MSAAEPAEPAEPTKAERADWARVRNLMMYAAEASLITLPSGERWLTDLYTLLRVTDAPALHAPHAEGEWDNCVISVGDDGEPYCDCQLADGQYKLTAGKGLVKLDRPNHSPPDIAGLLAAIEAGGPNWLPVSPTGWTVSESEAKAMLVWASDGQRRYALAVNEEVWTAYHDAYDRAKGETRRVRWEKDPLKVTRPYRVMLVWDGEGGECGEVLAYVMGIRLPNGHAPDSPYDPVSDLTKTAQLIVDEAA